MNKQERNSHKIYMGVSEKIYEEMHEKDRKSSFHDQWLVSRKNSGMENSPLFELLRYV